MLMLEILHEKTIYGYKYLTMRQIKEKPDSKERKNPLNISQKVPAKGSSSEGAKDLGDQTPASPEKSSPQPSDTKEVPSWVNAECFVKGSSMISLVVS